MRKLLMVAPLAATLCVFVACGQDGAQGVAGPAGVAGQAGTNGTNGQEGANGEGGASGSNGEGGANGEAGASIAPVDPTSGARLKARFTTTTTVGADGAMQSTRYFAGWYDSQRSEPCASGAAADGKTRCLPATVGQFGAYASDAACTKPVAVVFPSVPSCNAPAAALPKYVSTPLTVAGCSLSRLSPIGAKLPLATWYIKSGATCLSQGAPPAGWEIYDASGADVPPTDFVEFTVTTQTL